MIEQLQNQLRLSQVRKNFYTNLKDIIVINKTEFNYVPKSEKKNFASWFKRWVITFQREFSQKKWTLENVFTNS